jgi:hypothetical protein
MKTLTEFTGQNWLITPAALAVGQRQPANIHDQQWLLVLTGVVRADLKGNSVDQWLNETLQFQPDMSGPQQHGTSGPLAWAIDRFRVPKPSAPPDSYAILFSLEEWAPFASLSSIFDQNQSVNAGFAVNTWRPSPFGSTGSQPGSQGLGNDLITNQPVAQIFTGIRVDVAVRDSDAQILLIGYHITLLGRIVFPAIILG